MATITPNNQYNIILSQTGSDVSVADIIQLQASGSAGWQSLTDPSFSGIVSEWQMSGKVFSGTSIINAYQAVGGNGTGTTVSALRVINTTGQFCNNTLSNEELIDCPETFIQVTQVQLNNVASGNTTLINNPSMWEYHSTEQCIGTEVTEITLYSDTNTLQNNSAVFTNQQCNTPPSGFYRNIIGVGSIFFIEVENGRIVNSGECPP